MNSTLEDLFLAELADIYDAEHRIMQAWPQMAEAATDPRLQAQFEHHSADAREQVEKLEKVFQLFGQSPRRGKCAAMDGLIDETRRIIDENEDAPTMNAALISAAQKVEHYEIASYGCLREWAKLLGNASAAILLEDILDEEKAEDESLSELARNRYNIEAAVVAEAGIPVAP